MSYDYSKTNKIFWDTETTELYEFAYSMYITQTNEYNQICIENNAKTMLSYVPLSTFIRNLERDNVMFNNILDRALVELRKEKIIKIKKRIKLIYE